MDQKVLEAELQRCVDQHEVPGAVVGVHNGGQQVYACAGVTNVEHPLPVDTSTLFQFGSTGKTYTATAIMRLVEDGKVELDEPARRYVPELTLRDEQAARDVTVLQLLNHTAGWDGDLFDDTGDGDDALALLVGRMERLEQLTPPGQAVSYNNAALAVAGRLVENVTKQPFERSIHDLVLEPLGLQETFFFARDVMTHRFAVGHLNHSDGEIGVVRPWSMPRSGAAAGGLTASVRDLLAWARFHLGDGRGPDGTVVLSEASLARMQRPTAHMPGSALGDAVGISWLLRDLAGLKVVAHGGNTVGQQSSFLMIPERDFAVVTMTNGEPSGGPTSKAIVGWVLEAVLGVTEDEPEYAEPTDADLRAYIGTYETVAMVAGVVVDGDRLVVQVGLRESVLAELRAAGERPPERPPMPIRLLAGDGDRFVISDGPAAGQRGYFVRDGFGQLTGAHLGGRLALRTSDSPPAK